MRLRGLGGLIARIALVDKGDLDRFARHLLTLRHQVYNLRTILLMLWRDLQRQQVPQGIHGHVDFATPLALGAIATCPRLALRRRLQCDLPPFRGEEVKP